MLDIFFKFENIVDSFKNGTVIRGTVISKTKGGLIVDTGGLETFLPGSQIDIKPVMDYDQYVGKVMEFKVVKVNETIKNAVVSHKTLIESDLAEQREQIGTQKWLALYPDSFEAWAEFRRTGFPKLFNIANYDAGTDVAAGQFIQRIPYTDNIRSLNPTGVGAAETRMGGKGMAVKLWFAGGK